MPVRLSVTPATDPGSLEQYTFNKDRVTIGRDPDCDLVLPDVKRIVSKQHAALEIGTAGFELIDLGSKNFTFLNGMRLKSNEPQPLQSGDAIRIGEFEIGFTVVEAEPVRAAEPDRTVFLVNPFEEPAQQLAALLRRIEAAYETEVPGRREDALREALRNALDDARTDVRTAITRALDGGPGAAGAEAFVDPVAQPTSAAARTGRATVREDYDPGAAYERVFNTLLEFVPKVLGLPWHFRHEFIGQTIMHTPDAAALFEGGPEDVRRYLLDPSAREEELERRAVLLSETADEVVFHALAMVDGYRASVEQGISKMIDEIDPSRIEAEVRRTGGALKALPLMLESNIVARLREKVAELRAEDWSVVERRIYRPAFIKAYLGRMTSRRRPVATSSNA